MNDSGQVEGISTDALVHLFVLSRFSEGNPPAQALNEEFFSSLIFFVEAATEHPNLLKSDSGSSKDIVETFLNEHKAATTASGHANPENDAATGNSDSKETKEDDDVNKEYDTLMEISDDGSRAADKPQEDASVSASASQLTRDDITSLALNVHTANGQLDPSDINPTEIPSNSEFLAYVMPEQVPEQIQERKSLAELHITTQSQPVSRLLSGAHKTLRTEHYKLSLIEGKLGIIHNRIEELRNNDRWSLRQRARFIDPPCEKTHTDYLLEEVQWMRTNFHEERKFTIAIAYCLAKEAAEFVNTKQLKPAVEDPPKMEFNIKKTSLVPKEDKLLPLIAAADNLDGFSDMIYSSLHEGSCIKWGDNFVRDWNKLPYIPVSKFLIAPEDIDDWQRVVIENPREIPELLSYTESDPSLPRLFNRHQNSSDVRAPKPPDARYINYRLVTIWLPQDDKMLLSLAGQLGYNWELVSSYLMPGMQYTADIERRTPWQCFERWLQLNPTFEVKDLKGRYAEQARIWLDSSSKAQLAVKRRIAPVGVSADNLQRGHKRLRWSSMFDAIRKVKRKRESQPKGNPMRRQAAIEGAQAQGAPARGTPTAAELSRIKFERDRAVAEAYAQEQRTQSQGGRGGSGTSRTGTDALRSNVQATRASTAPSSSTNSTTATTPNTTIAGLPVPNSVAAAAAANAANNGNQFTQEQLQQYLSERRRKMPGQIGTQVGAQVSGGAGSGMATPIKAAPGSASGTPNQAFNGNFSFMGGSPQLQKAATSYSTGSPHGSPAPRAQVAQPGTTPARRAPLTREQATALMAKIAQKHPNLTREQVQQLATQEIQLYIQKRSAAQAAQAARNAQAQAQAQSGSQAHSRAGTPLQNNPNNTMGSPGGSFMR